jgi:hypothetical protein
MNRWKMAAVVAAAAAIMLGGAALAQESVGDLRIVDETGQTIGQQEAPAGEKLYRLPTGVTAFMVAMDYDASAATDVLLKVMGPSGTVLFQNKETLSQPGTHTVQVSSDGGQPFADQEYVVNVYVGADAYLADSLQLVVGEAQLPTPEEAEATTEARSLDPLAASTRSAAGQQASSRPLSSNVPGGPSKSVLALAVAGILVLCGIVIWAAWSATRHA